MTFLRQAAGLGAWAHSIRVIAVWLLLAATTNLATAAELGFSTFLAGIRRDEGVKVAIAPDGSIVIAGETDSPDFPTVRALQGSRPGWNSAFVMKLDPSGKEIVFSTYFGGSCCEFISDLALDSKGDIYFAGSTLSNEFPLVRELRSERQDVDGFLVKMSGDGRQILFSTYFGGAGVDAINAIAVERPDQVFVVGTTSSSDLHGLIPPLINPWTSFLAKIDTDASHVVSVADFGGSNFELSTSLAYDHARKSLWVAGMTRSNDFPTLRPLRPTSGTIFSEAGFIVRFSTLSEVPVKKSSSVLPGPVTALSLDRRGRAHIALHRLDRALVGYQDFRAGCKEGFPYLRLQPNGRGLQLWRCLAVSPTAMTTDRKRRIYIAASPFFPQPLVDPIQTTIAGGKDIYLMVLEPGATRLRFATFLGGRADDIPHGLAVSKRGKRIFLTGVTRSIDFPLASAVQPVKPGSNRTPGGFVSEIRP